jgi:nucleoside 2-deoxyribosyltransferase
MNIYVAHSINMDYKKDLYNPIRSSGLNAQHNFILPHEFQDTAYNVKPEMESKQIDVLVADLSLPSTGQGVEIGWANMLNIPIICIYKNGAKTSRTTKSLAKVVLEYSDINEIPRVVETALLQISNST